MIRTPFTIMISGPSGCGKTTFVLNLLNSLKKFDKIIWCNAERNAIPKCVYNDNNIEVIRNIPDNFDNVPCNTLIILDDLMLEAYNKNVCELFTKGSHHRNISVILTTQNVFHQGKHARDISLNCKYLVFFKNPRDQSQIFPLARQIYPENSRQLIKVYKEVTEKPFSYLLFDLTQTGSELTRFRTEVFNKDFLVCYIPQSVLENRKICSEYEKIGDEQTFLTYIEKC